MVAVGTVVLDWAAAAAAKKKAVTIEDFIAKVVQQIDLGEMSEQLGR